MERTMNRPAGRRRRRSPAAVGAFLAAAASALPAWAMQILPATDHAELSAEVSATSVNRVALDGDRVARVIRSPDGFAVEHDPKRGDVYLRPLRARGSEAPYGAADADAGADGPPRTATLFLGTEKGFTYRLTLAAVDRDSAQVLIRNAAALDAVESAAAFEGETRRAALVALVRAVARREPLPGYVIESPARTSPGPLAAVETWRGARFVAHVFEVAAAEDDASALASRLGAGVAAAWVSGAGTGPGGGRLGVAVRDHGAGAGR